MTTEAEFDRPEIAALIEQARVASSMPVAVHRHTESGEDARVAGSGSCAVCRCASSTSDGAAACRDSRGQAATQALNRNRPVAFTCHLGLSCVAAPLLNDSNERCAITFGPFCPAEAPEGLDTVVTEGLRALEIDDAPELNDIARVSADGVPILVDWTIDRLRKVLQQLASDETPAETIEHEEPTPMSARPVKSRARASGPASIIVVALASGDRVSARWFVRNALEEAASMPGGGVQARTVSLASHVLEAADYARLPTEEAWAGMNALVEVSRQTTDIATLSRACMRVFGAVLKQIDERTANRIATIFREVTDQFGDGILLDDVAAKTGTDPTAITHLLQRRFDLNFSELVGKVRVERAKRLLRDSQLSIAEIATRVGVSDASNFGRLFRKFDGTSPLHYRERFRRAA